MQKKVKIGEDVLHGTSKCSTDFQSERSKVKVTGRKPSKIWRDREAAPADQGQQAATAHWAYAIVSPSLLSAPEILGNGTDGRKCRCRRFLFLYYFVAKTCQLQGLFGCQIKVNHQP